MWGRGWEYLLLSTPPPSPFFLVYSCTRVGGRRVGGGVKEMRFSWWFQWPWVPWVPWVCACFCLFIYRVEGRQAADDLFLQHSSSSIIVVYFCVCCWVRPFSSCRVAFFVAVAVPCFKTVESCMVFLLREDEICGRRFLRCSAFFFSFFFLPSIHTHGIFLVNFW